MMIQSVSASFFTAGIARSASPRQAPAAAPANIADTVRISRAAREAFAATSASAAANGDRSVEARLAEIRAMGPVNRSPEDHDFLFANDKRLAEVTQKSHDRLTADEIDYMQKSAGFVNTFANLSPAEKALYDKAVASGNKEAAAGIGQVAFIRMMGHTAGGTDGTTYDPLNTEITAANIEKFFSHSIVDPTGKAGSQFQALIRFLQDNPVA